MVEDYPHTLGQAGPLARYAGPGQRRRKARQVRVCIVCIPADPPVRRRRRA